MLIASTPFRVTPVDVKSLPTKNQLPVIAIRELDSKDAAKGPISVIVADLQGNAVELKPGQFRIRA
jgi:hypothetical protein